MTMIRVADLIPGDIAELYWPAGARFLVLGGAEARAGFVPVFGDKLCLCLDDMRLSVLFEDDEVRLLVRAQ